jgi:hypothetical protein
MGTRLIRRTCCDVFPAATRKLGTYEVTIRQTAGIGSQGLLEPNIVFERCLILCPRALKRALNFIGRATSPPTKGPVMAPEEIIEIDEDGVVHSRGRHSAGTPPGKPDATAAEGAEPK